MLKLTIKTPERRHLRSSGVFIVNFDNISHIFLVFLWLTLNMYMFVGGAIQKFSKLIGYCRCTKYMPDLYGRKLHLA